MDKSKAFDSAKEMVDPIVEENGLEDYTVWSYYSPTPYSTRVTKAEQHVDLILKVADWLLQDAYLDFSTYPREAKETIP